MDRSSFTEGLIPSSGGGGGWQERRGWGAGGQLPPLASEIRKFSEIQKFLGNSLSVSLLAQTTCLSFHSFKLHSYIVETNYSIWDTDWKVLLIWTIH